MKQPKCLKTRALIERLNIYLRDNPTCRFKDAAAILDIKPTRIRKWKEYGWINHITDFALRQKQQQEQLALLTNTQPVSAPGRPPDPVKPARPSRSRKPQSGVVAPVYPADAATSYAPDSIDGLIARGKDLKISELRALIKAHLMTQVHDAKAVSNYAAGLRALSGVQDVELEDIYETESMVRVYVPAEDLIPVDVLEVDPIEY